MAKKRNYLGLNVGLAEPERKKLDELHRVTGKTKSEIARDAIRFYLDNYERLNTEQKEAPIERRLRKMEDRLAALMARTAIDVGTVYTLLWHRSDADDRKDLFGACYTQAVDRLKKKLTGLDAEVKDIMKNEISS
jgi:uncharacterized protein (UPF0335 family)